MAKKLTLSMNEAVIEAAKEYANAQGVSLSKFVENFLQKTTSYKPIDRPKSKDTDTPLTDGLVGILENKDLNMDDYRLHQAQKHGVKT